MTETIVWWFVGGLGIGFAAGYLTRVVLEAREHRKAAKEALAARRAAYEQRVQTRKLRQQQLASQ